MKILPTLPTVFSSQTPATLNCLGWKAAMVDETGARNVPAFSCGRQKERSDRQAAPYRPRCELNRRYSSTDASISDFRMETLSTLMPMGKRFSRA